MRRYDLHLGSAVPMYGSHCLLEHQRAGGIWYLEALMEGKAGIAHRVSLEPGG